MRSKVRWYASSERADAVGVGSPAWHALARSTISKTFISFSFTAPPYCRLCRSLGDDPERDKPQVDQKRSPAATQEGDTSKAL
jgi:hypothetical protein